MKKMGLMLVSILAFGTGCKRQKQEAIPEEHIEINNEKQENQSKSLFVDDVDAFILEDESDPFISSTGYKDGDISLVAPEGWEQERNGQYAFKTIYFDFDQYEVRSDQQNILDFDLKKAEDAVAQGHTLVIEGHACKFAGSATYNMMLSEKRAQAVKNYFVHHGISANKIKVVGRGHEMCLVPEGDKEAQAPNRRVEIYILK